MALLITLEALTFGKPRSFPPPLKLLLCSFIKNRSQRPSKISPLEASPFRHWSTKRVRWSKYPRSPSSYSRIPFSKPRFSWTRNTGPSKIQLDNFHRAGNTTAWDEEGGDGGGCVVRCNPYVQAKKRKKREGERIETRGRMEKAKRREKMEIHARRSPDW